MDNTTPTLATDRAPRLPRIVIVGGGAGGLQLATRLGDTIGRRGQADIVLVDRYPTHFWKPLLHEAASGHRDPASHTIEYAAQAKRHGFRFVQGALQQVDRGTLGIRLCLGYPPTDSLLEKALLDLRQILESAETISFV